MGDLTANKQRPYRLAHGNLAIAKVPLANIAETVYVGSVLMSDVSANDGYFRAMSTGVTAASGDIVGGVCLDKQTMTTGNSDGDKWATVARNGVWGFPKNSLAQTDIGAAVYTSDDGDTVTTSSTNTLWIGILEEVDATYAWVNIERAFLRANSAT